jgi:hypothetical protein
MLTFPILVRPLSIIACLFRILLLVLFAGQASAEQPFSFATTPGQLPETVMPVHYALDLKPDFDRLSFTGTEIVDIDVAAPAANRLVLNAVDLTIENASIDGDNLPSTAIMLDAAAETLTLSLPHPISMGRHQLSLTYAGRINRFGRGLFMIDYPTPFQVRSATVRHRRHGGVIGGRKGQGQGL